MPKDERNALPFISRRSPVVCRHACVATSQPLASSIGLDLLRQGANAAETAVAIAAVLAVTEPHMTGLGGDMFCLYFDASSKQVSSINGSGKSCASLDMDLLRQTYPDERSANGINADNYRTSPHAVTVPGTAQGWEDLLQRHGSGREEFCMATLLEPAAKLAEEGFPVAPIAAYHWRDGLPQVKKHCLDGEAVPLTVDGSRGPEAGEIFCNPDLARVFRDFGKGGAQRGFYQGQAGRAIVAELSKRSGDHSCLSMEDLKNHTSDFPSPIFAAYRGCKLWQVPPNGQGIAGLIALSGLQQLEERGIVAPLSNKDIGSADMYHVLLEMMRLGFSDARAFVGDPSTMTVDTDWLLDAERIGSRAAKLYDPAKATIHGIPDVNSCTVSFQVVDQEGNAVSFVNSNYQSFGTGIVPKSCGFPLQNRGFGFTLQEGHPNMVAPCKRPYHTIIPGMLTHGDTNELYATITNMGAMMQPQGHLQLTVDMLACGLDPQAAIDMPRFCIADGTQGGVAQLEEGVNNKVVEELEKRGHLLDSCISGQARFVFGRAQIIKKDRVSGVLWAGSDGRADGCAMGF